MHACSQPLHNVRYDSIAIDSMGLQLLLRGHEGDPALAAFCVAMAGCWLGFLAHNRHPARLFMGDTGSLAMGTALAAVALLSNSLWPLLVMGGVFLAADESRRRDVIAGVVAALEHHRGPEGYELPAASWCITAVRPD